MTNNSVRAVHFLLALLVVILDRWTKRLVAAHIPMYTHIQIIPGFFRITHTENTGAAFSLFADSPSHFKTAALISFSVVAMIVVSILLWRQTRALTVTGIAFSLILGGAAGNLWDRVASGRGFSALLREAIPVAGVQLSRQRDRSRSQPAGARDHLRPPENRHRFVTAPRLLLEQSEESCGRQVPM